MDQKENYDTLARQMKEDTEKKILQKSSPETSEYWAKRRWKWDEWGSPVGLGLAWALFVIPLGLFLYLLHLAGLLR